MHRVSIQNPTEIPCCSSASDIMAQELTVPDGPDTALRVYNEGLEKPFLLREKDEVCLCGCCKVGDMILTRLARSQRKK